MGCFTYAVITSDLSQNHRQGVYAGMDFQAIVLKVYNMR